MSGACILAGAAPSRILAHANFSNRWFASLCHQTNTHRWLGGVCRRAEPLKTFLSNVPRASGLAYVIVQHMDPTRKTMLGELLQRATAMPVLEATELLQVQPDSVYVIPPNAELTVAEGLLRLAAPSQPRGLRLPIDVLFVSLARDLGDRAIGVVLSGMGSAGTLGLQAIARWSN